MKATGGNGMTKPYWEKLKDPRWQRLRLEAMQEAEFTCEICGDGQSTLNVHHKQYFKGREPWEYDVRQLAVLCESCHSEHHGSDDLLNLVCSFLPVDGPHSRETIASLVAGYACLENPGCIDPFAMCAGMIARSCIGTARKAKIHQIIALAELSQKDGEGMLEALLEYAHSKGADVQ